MNRYIVTTELLLAKRARTAGRAVEAMSLKRRFRFRHAPRFHLRIQWWQTSHRILLRVTPNWYRVDCEFPASHRSCRRRMCRRQERIPSACGYLARCEAGSHCSPCAGLDDTRFASCIETNQCEFKHSSRSRPLNDSTCALSVALPGREKSIFTLFT